MKKFLASALIAILAVGGTTITSAQNWTKYRIMLDPGHGGTDPGASGPSAPHEATLALRCAKSLATKLTNLGGTYKLTRTTDTYVSLSARKSACSSYDPYIFCSIHLNAANTTAYGTETWYYWSTGNSKALATKVQASLVNEMGRSNRGVKQNGWTVITASSSMPACLTEGLFVDNPTEWALIKTEGSSGYNNWVNGHLYGFYDHLTKTVGASITNPRTSTTTPTNPTITVDTSSWTFNCENGTTDTYDFTVTGTDLSAAISISSNNSVFTVNKTSVAKAGGTFTVTFTPTAVGSVTGKITLTSGSVSKTISLTGKATAPTLKLTTKWRACDERSNAERFGWNALNVRNMDYNKGKLYLVYDHSDIKVVNAQTGAELGNLAKDVVSDGVITLCDVKVIEDKIIASNIGNTTQNKPLKVYIWDDDNSQARVMLETSDFGGATRLGDCICYKGTLASGKLIFVNDDGTTTRLVKYTVTDGVANPTPAVTNVTTDGTTQLKTSASTRAVYDKVNGVNGFWIDGKENYTAFINTSGVRQFYMDSDETWGNAISRFTWKDSEYAVTTVYNPMEGDSWTTQTDEQKAKNYTCGRMRLLRNDDTWSKATTLADYPAAGLSKTRQNTNCTSSVITSVNGETVEAWILTTNQGIGYYISEGSTAPTYETEVITPATPAMMVSPASVEMSTQVGTPATSSVSLQASALTSDIAVTISGTGASQFSVSATSLSQSTTSASVTVTYSPTAAGTHEATLTFSSGELICNVALTGTATALPVLQDDNIGTLTEVWKYSEISGNLATAPWFSASSPESRDMCLMSGKLYVLNAHAWNTSPVINILDAYTGTSEGTMNTTGISGGESYLASVRAFGGKIIACNGARATDALKIYKWDSTTGAPTEWFSDSSHGGIHCGEIMSISGDMTNGRIMFSDGSAIVVYTVSAGVVNATPTVITITRNGEASPLGSNKSSCSVTYCSNDTYWLTAKGATPTQISATGEILQSIPASAMTADMYGTATCLFPFGSRNYFAATGYLDKTSSTLSEGTLQLLDVTSGVASAQNCGVYPAEGLGTTRNTIFQSAICHENVNYGTKVNLWVLVSMQGIAMYTYDGGVTPGALTGDLNADGAIDGSDLGALINMIVGSSTVSSMADINGDGEVNSSDLAALINMIVGI